MVNVQVAEQGFPLGSMDNDIADLIESFEPAANPSYRRWTWTRSCMPTLTLDLWDILVVLVVMNRFDLWDVLANM
jgi:hypothetical protein